MADDLVTRLREHSSPMCGACDTWGKCGFGEPCDCRCHMNFCRDAADEIERMRTECERLQQLLHAAPGWAERPFMHTVLAMEQQAEIERLRTLIARFAVADRTWEFTQKYDEDYHDVEREYQDALAALLQEARRG